MPKRELLPAPPPREVNTKLIVGIGTAIWLVALVVLFVLRDDLADAGQSVWLWTCLIGVSLGVFGFGLLSRRRSPRPTAEDDASPVAQ